MDLNLTMDSSWNEILHINLKGFIDFFFTDETAHGVIPLGSCLFENFFDGESF